MKYTTFEHLSTNVVWISKKTMKIKSHLIRSGLNRIDSMIWTKKKKKRIDGV